MKATFLFTRPFVLADMKATVLFGLLACATQPRPSYPLCDRTGAPACGNIGQAGRPEKSPRPTQVLLGASARQTPTTPIARPLADDRENYVCANVMTKGGSHRKCHPVDPTLGASDIEIDE